MGTTSTHTIKADLNGTGTLVDITAYVDQAAGITHSWGRSDWTTAEQPPGRLTLTLENLDGRFTPGSTAVYAVGVVKNMCVEWTCDSRIRRFYLQTPALRFDAAMGGQSKVVLQCRDALGLLADRKMRSMLAEQTLAMLPVAYWPLDDNSSDQDNTLCREISGKSQPALFPATSVYPAAPTLRDVGDGSIFGFAQGRGPRTDAAGALRLNSTDTPRPVAAAATTGMLRNAVTLPLARQGADAVQIPDLTTQLAYSPNTPSDTTSGWNLPSKAGYSMQWTFSMWFSIDDIYGPTSSTAADIDGPYVHLATIEGTAYGLYWRIPDRCLVLATQALSAPYVWRLSVAGSGSCSVSAMHHIVIEFEQYDSAYNGGFFAAYGDAFRGYLDGQPLSLGAGAAAHSRTFSTQPRGVTLGAPAALGTFAGADRTVYQHSGTVAHVSIHGPSEMGLPPDPYYGAAGTHLAAIELLYSIGAEGPQELADARFLRLGGWWDGPQTLAFSAQGDPQEMLLGPADTDGKSMLAVMCQALACEEASLSTETVAGVDTVYAWLDSFQRPVATTLTIDAAADAHGAPELSYDASGVAASAEGKGWNMATAYTDPVAPARWVGTTATVKADVAASTDLQLFTQYRTIRGRAVKVTPTKITVDTVSSKNNVTASMLGLRPGVTVTLAGLPSGVLGYSSIDCVIVGATEKHSLGQALFELTLIPRTQEMLVDPELGTEGPWRLVDTVAWRLVNGSLKNGQFQALAGTTGGGQLSAAATTGYLMANYYADASLNANPGLEGFSTDAADYPLSIRVDNEIITLPNAPGARTASTFSAGTASPVYYQQVTGMLRGQAGTTAAIHGSNSSWDTTGLSGDQGLAVVYLPENEPLLAF